MVLGLLTLTVACDGNGNGTNVQHQPPPSRGTVVAPRDPIIVQRLPTGWSLTQAELPTRGPAYWNQTLYLAPGATPERGRALAVGQFDQLNGGLLCGKAEQLRIDPGFSLSGGRLRRSGSLIEISGEPHEDTPAYVLGRGLTRDELVRAARSVRFPNTDPPVVTIPKRALPDELREAVVAPVIPNGIPGGTETIGMVRDGTHEIIFIGAYDGNRGADPLTRFWKATVTNLGCGGQFPRATLRQVGGTSVLILARTSKPVIEEVASNLAVTDQDGWATFRAGVGQFCQTVPVACQYP